MRLNGSDFLLPSEARLDSFFNMDGSKNENHTSYSGCHEFRAESTVSFEPPPNVPQQAARKAGDPPPLGLPEGLPFQMAFTQDIDTAAAAGGDAIKAILTTPIQDRSRVLVPRGAIVTGRIIRIQHAFGSRPSVTMTLRLETVDAGAGPRALRATGDSGNSTFPARSGTLRRRIEPGDLNSLEDRNQGISVFANANEKYVIRFGTETKWLTLGP